MNWWETRLTIGLAIRDNNLGKKEVNKMVSVGLLKMGIESKRQNNRI